MRTESELFKDLEALKKKIRELLNFFIKSRAIDAKIIINNNISDIIKKFEKISYNNNFKPINNSQTYFSYILGSNYSRFLSQTQPNLSKDKGVINTPDEVISFMIRGIDFLLQKKEIFDYKGGILDTRVKFIDPASGTQGFGSMLLNIANQKLNEGFNEWCKEFLKQFRTFEVLFNTYILGYARILLEAEKLGINLNSEDYQTNLLLKNPLANPFDLILDNDNVVVVMGNPPYNIVSQNTGSWIMEKTNEYIAPELMVREKGKPTSKYVFSGKSVKDEYMKFIRFGQWLVTEKADQGIIAYVTNGFYLDGHATRGMRKVLRRKFDEIWIIDLHGDVKKGLSQRARDMCIAIDENVFEGVGRSIAIAFFVRYPPDKHKNHKKGNPLNCLIKYIDKWGTRDQKLEFLVANDLTSLDFEDVGDSSDHEFTPLRVEEEIKENYEKFPYLCSIFQKHIQGIVTAHDTLVSGYTKEEVEEKLNNFYYGVYQKEEKINPKNNYKYYNDGYVSYADNVNWKIDNARGITPEEIQKNYKNAISNIYKWNYRGFDERYIAYENKLNYLPRFELMQYLITEQNRENVAMIINRCSRGKACDSASSVFISDKPVEHATNEGSSGLDSFVFPLKINISNEKDDFNNPKLAEHSNINPSFIALLPYKNALSDYNVFYYIYGILYTPKYRQMFRYLVKDDFPRIPFPTNQIIFNKMAKKGKELAELHLLISPKINIEDISINTKAKNLKILNPFYDLETKRLYFNKFNNREKEETFWIGNISEDIWNFEIGGRRQIELWLKARRYINPKTPKRNRMVRGLQNSPDELIYLRKMISAIRHTIEIQRKLDITFKEILNDLP